MGIFFRIIIASLFFVSLASAQENLLPIKSSSSAVALAPEPVTLTPLIHSKKEEESSKTTSGNYLAETNSSSDTFRFKIKTENSNHEPMFRIITMGRTVHNNLLRKALLQKIGYGMPALSYLPKITIEFKDRIEKATFIKKLEDKTNADTDRWIVSDDQNKLELQDVLVSEDEEMTDDLASGTLNHQNNQSKKEYSSLIIPFVLTNVPEGINIFSWVSGTVYGNSVKVEYPNSDSFTPSAEDILWILKKISTLTRNDWKEVVSAAQLPDSVQTLLLEKLIARRNSFLELFNIDEDRIDFDFQISTAPELNNGQIILKKWPGYATKFTTIEPDSPFNPGENFAFAESGLFSSIISSAVGKLNQLPVLSNNFTTPGKWAFPFANGTFIFSREIVTGSYLGDHLIQIADSFGIRTSIGARLNMSGMPTAMGMSFMGSVSASRTYSHLKPMNSIRKANRYGYQNIIIPYFTHSSAKQLDPIFEDGFETLPIEQKKQIYEQSLLDFKNKLAPGESLVITDSLIADGKISANVSLYQLIDVSAFGEDKEIVMSRLHIYRKDENTFQIYKDYGEATQPSFGIEIGIRKGIASLPVIKAKWGKNTGKSKIQYFSINFENKAENNGIDESISQLKIVQQLIKRGNIEVLKKHTKPFLIENHFKEENQQDRVLFFGQRRLRSVSDITVTSPDGTKNNFVHDFFGKSYTFDYGNTSRDILNFANEYFTNSLVTFAEDSNVNPGYTSKGHSKNQLLEFDAEKMPDGTLKDRYVKISRVFNGWSLPKEKVLLILDQLSKEYGGELFPPNTLNETEKMLLYTITLNISLYEEGIHHLETLTKEDIRNIFKKYAFDLKHRSIDDRIINRIQEFKETHSSKALLRAISIADHFLPAEGFIEFMGGKNNVLINAKVEGYRKGDERVDSPILSNTIGSAINKKVYGPLTEIRKKMGMSENEFLSLWILGRIL